MMPTVHSTNSPSRPFQYHDKDAHAEADEASFESSSDTLFSNSLNHSSSYLPCKESYEQSIRVDIASDRYNYTQRDVSGSVSPMSAGSEWEERKRSRTVGILQLLREKASARCYYAAGAVAILLLVSILSTSTPVVKHISSTINDFDVSGLTDKIATSLGQGSSKCDDPFAMPGYIWYGEGSQDVRWVPYKNLNASALIDYKNVALYDPVKESDANKTASNSPPPASNLPLELSKLFKTYKSREEFNETLTFMRNKHIMVYGSSLDREMMQMFCNDHEHKPYEGGKQFMLEHHRHAYCHFEDYNFTISSAMHFGLHQTSWWHGGDALSFGTEVEDRVDSVVVPLAEKFGKPSLFVFSSGLWDLNFFKGIEMRKDPTVLISTYLPVSYERLMWQRARLAHVIETLRDTFPGMPILYRTTTQPGDRRSTKDDEMTAVFQINQSARAAMKQLGVPLFHWPELIKGSHSFRDFIHYETESRQNWLYGEMLLYTLQQVSDPKADTSCWLDR